MTRSTVAVPPQPSDRDNAMRRSTREDAGRPVTGFAAVLFDMDGVVTDTAAGHAAAWKQTFDAFLEAHARASGTVWRPFDAERDYRALVDGKPRYDGVADFLAARGLTLPPGTSDDAPGMQTICALGNRKNELYLAWLERRAVSIFPGTLRLLHELRAAGVRTAVFSASRNARAVLARAGAGALFDACVDGEDLDVRGLAGKPDPACLSEAASRLGVAPERTVVVEDAIAGIEAARRGGFGQAVGIDRDGARADALRRAGADIVADDLAGMMWSASGGLAARTPMSLPLAREREAEIRRRVSGRRLAVFLDYDGTLSPIVVDFTRAFMSDSMRAAVAELARHCMVAVVSGRDAETVQELVRIDTIRYAGSHGFEIVAPDGWRFETGTDVLPDLDDAERALRDALAGIPGHAVERQRFAIAVHFRRAAAVDAVRIEQEVDRVLADRRRLRKGAGKKVIRVQPAIDWDKGRAVGLLLDRLGVDGPDVVPVYLGDDVTDEDAFVALLGRGLTMVVRDKDPRPTVADYALAGVDDVECFLGLLADIARARGAGAA